MRLRAVYLGRSKGDLSKPSSQPTVIMTLDFGKQLSSCDGYDNHLSTMANYRGRIVAHGQRGITF